MKFHEHLDRRNKTSNHGSSKHSHYFGDGDVFIINNTKSFPRPVIWRERKTGAKIESFLLRN